MSVVKIACPSCGSSSCVKGERANEYRCTNCKTAFALIDYSQHEVTTDTTIHNCPHCGKQVEAGHGYKCTLCERNYFCEFCISEAKGKCVCLECLKTSKRDCKICGHYSYYECENCGKRACKNHVDEVGFIVQPSTNEGYIMQCERCKAVICTTCAKRKMLSLLADDYYCPVCDGKLIFCQPNQQ